jgi:hypothetical protein
VVSGPPDVVEVVEALGLVVLVVVVVADAGAVADVVEEVEELVAAVVDVVVSAAASIGMTMATTNGAAINEARTTFHAEPTWDHPVRRPAPRRTDTSIAGSAMSDIVPLADGDDL